jgi:hypothetical protein
VLLAVLLPLGTYRRLCLYLSPCAEEPICDPNDVAAEGEDPLGSRADLALTIGLREALYASNCMWGRFRSRALPKPSTSEAEHFELYVGPRRQTPSLVTTS